MSLDTLERGRKLLMKALQIALKQKATDLWLADVQAGKYNDEVMAELPVGKTMSTSAQIVAAKRRVAEKLAQAYIENAIGSRLAAAITFYKLDEEIESLRHVLIALAAVTGILGWKEATSYLEEQSHELFRLRQSEARRSGV